MDITQLAHRIIGSLYSFFSKRIVYHFAFWGFYLLVFTLLLGSRNGYLFTLSMELINVACFAVVVYFNLFYLIPTFLARKQFIRYLALMTLSVLVITPLRIFFLYIRLTAYPELQDQLVDDQLLMFISTFLIVGLSTLSKIVTDWIRHQRELQELEKQTMQSELRFLKSQINPHFLFNTLNNLYALTLKKSDKAPDIVLKLSAMMRYMLYECNEKRVALSKELDYVKNYLELEQLRQGKNKDIKFEIAGETDGKYITPMLFIPFLENSFKHGLQSDIDEGYVHIFVGIKGKLLDFYISNSKPMVKPGNIISGGIGLVNIKRRLNLIYPSSHEIIIDEQPEYYNVHLKIKLDENQDHDS